MVQQKMDGYHLTDKLAVPDAVIVDKVQIHLLLQCNIKNGWTLLQVNKSINIDRYLKRSFFWYMIIINLTFIF